MPLPLGTRLGTYEIVQSLGAGGMGEVYRAKDLRLGRHVALKVLPTDVARQPDRLARFEQEARTVAGLNHPNIVTLYSVEDEDGVRFLTMELVEGRSLADFIVPGGSPIPQIIDVALAMTDALVAAQSKGVIHRDLKPGNVMVTNEDRIKVLDFGLAKVAYEESPLDDATAASPITEAGQVFGTVPYMAPEQLRGDSVDARCDLFALGIILYELAAGQRPFSGRTHADLISSILRDAPKPLAQARPDLPRDFARVIHRCLEKDPKLRPASAFELSQDLHALDRVPEAAPPSPDLSAVQRAASIAVLPFVNRSPDEGDEYFSDGLADELLVMLSNIPQLHVAARTSSFRFKGGGENVAMIGRQLNVATLLEGSVRRSGKRVRIAVQLVEAETGYHLWSEAYDRTLDDIFAVQDDIARSVVQELRSTLLGEDPSTPIQVKEDVANAARGRPTDPEAYRLFLLARHFIERWTQEDVAKGIHYLETSLELDPEFAVGWAELSRARTTEAGCGWVSASKGHELARQAALRALTLRPDLADGYVRLAWIQMIYDWDWKGAQFSLGRARELAPNDDRVLHMSAVFARNTGRVGEAVEFNQRALDRDPLSSATYLNLGLNLYAADRDIDAEAAFRQSLEFAPDGTVAHGSLALAMAAQGRVEEAIAEAQAEPEESIRLWALAVIHAQARRTEAGNAALRTLIENHAGSAPTLIAEAHAVRGEGTSAFEWLERAYAERDGGLTEIKASPHLRSIHDDPRWDAFMRKMGFEA